MKKTLLILTIFCILFSIFPLYAAEEVVLIESESEWKYFVVDDAGFDAMDGDWMMPDYSENWELGTAPFGDRIIGSRGEEYGWSGEHHGIFLRHTFSLHSDTDLSDMHFYMRCFYDNTVHIYLNGVEIFADDNAGSDWVDDYEIFKLDNISEHLQNGQNILAVSVHDDVGGREFDLKLFATKEELDIDSDQPEHNDPVQKPTDDPSDNPTDESDKVPTDFGNSLPFTKSPVPSAPPAVTVYLTSETPPAPSPSYTAPIAMMSASLAVSMAMIVVAIIISHRRNRTDGDRQ